MVSRRTHWIAHIEFQRIFGREGLYRLRPTLLCCKGLGQVFLKYLKTEIVCEVLSSTNEFNILFTNLALSWTAFKKNNGTQKCQHFFSVAFILMQYSSINVKNVEFRQYVVHTSVFYK